MQKFESTIRDKNQLYYTIIQKCPGIPLKIMPEGMLSQELS